MGVRSADAHFFSLYPLYTIEHWFKKKKNADESRIHLLEQEIGLLKTMVRNYANCSYVMYIWVTTSLSHKE